MAIRPKDGDSDLARPADEIDPDAAGKLLQWALGENEASRVQHPPRHHLSMRRRMTHLRAAFVGDVRMSFVVVLAFFFVAGAGWFAAHIWYQEAKASEIERARSQGAAEERGRVLDFITRVQSSPEANAELLRAADLLYKAMQETGYDPGKLNQDQ